MKKIVLTSLLSAFAMAVNAAPLVTVGDQMDIFFRGSVIGNYNSNITYASGGANKKLEDYSGTLRLGGEIDYGRTSKFKANIKFYEDITRYVDHKEFDNNLAHIMANTSYVEANWNVRAYFSFDQMYQNDSDLIWGTNGVNIEKDLISYNLWRAGVKGSYDFSEKVYGTLGFDWRRTEYIHKWNDIYSSYDVFSLPVSVLYRVTQKIAVGLSYQYRLTDYFDGPAMVNNWGNERNDHFFGLTVNGEIAPKLTCEAYLGAQYRDYGSDQSNDTTLAGKITLGYEVTEKLGVYVKASRDFGSSATRYSYVNTQCEGGLNYYFNPKIVGTASLTYRVADYELIDRKDETVWTRLGISYVPNKFVTLSLNYNYLNNNCDEVETANYNQHLLSFSASLRY